MLSISYAHGQPTKPEQSLLWTITAGKQVQTGWLMYRKTNTQSLRYHLHEMALPHWTSTSHAWKVD